MTGEGGSRPFAWHLLLAAGYGMVLAAIPLLNDPAAYFRDDMESYFVPTLIAAGRTMWSAGAVPLLTLHSWAGGNLAAEFQYALFNPVMLALYAALPAFGDQAAAAGFLGIALGGVLTAGGLALGRALGLPIGLAHVAAAAVGGNAFLYFWFAASWFPGYGSTAFMVWAMAFVAIAHRGRGAFLGCVAATFLTTTAGWPQAVFALGAFTLVWLIALQRREGWRPAIDAGSAALLGVLAGAVAIGPLLGLAEVARRSTEIGNAGLLVANLRDVLSLSSPLHFAVLPLFDHATLLQAPVFLAAWFVLPLAALIDWSRVSWKEPRVVALIGFAGLMVMATQGPSQLLWMRYPIKFLPYVQIGAVLLVLVLLRDAGFAPPSRRRTLVLAGLLAVATVSSLQSAPVFPVLHIGIAILSGVTMLLLQRDARDRLDVVAGVLFGSTWAVAALLRIAIPGPLVPEGGVFPPFNVPREIAGAPSLTTVPTDYELILAERTFPGRHTERVRELPFGQIGLQQGRAMISGYSPIGHRGLSRLFCYDNSSRWVCPETAALIRQPDPATGVPLADLFRIGRIVVERSPDLAEAAAGMGPPWREAAASGLSLTFERPLPNASLPGSLAWPLDGLRAEAAGPATARHEALRLSDLDPAVTSLIFARAWWPGYAATLDGAALPVRAHDGMLVAVDLPPGVRGGELVLSFTPSGLREGAVVSVAAILAALVWAAFLHGTRPRRA